MPKFPEKLNEAIQDTTGSESQGKDAYELELVQSQELNNLSNTLNEVQKTIEENKDLNTLDLLSLKEAVGNIKVDIGGEEFTLEEVKDIENLKENVKIWKEIEEGGSLDRVRDLSILSPKVADILINCMVNIYFDSLKFLSNSTAEVLIKCRGDLGLQNLTSLSDLAAESLSKHEGRPGFEGNLYLNSLRSLSDSAAESLAKHKGEVHVSNTIKEKINKYKK